MITQKEAVQRLYNTYSKYGITEELLNKLFEDGVNNQHFSPQETFNLLRMSLGHEFREREYFSLNDVMAITGERREELLQRIEQCRQELIETGEDPDDYFKPVEPQRAAVYYFPNGLH